MIKSDLKKLNLNSITIPDMDEVEGEIRDQVKIITHVITEHINKYESYDVTLDIRSVISQYSNKNIYKNPDVSLSILKNKESIKSKIDSLAADLNERIVETNKLRSNYNSILELLKINLSKVESTQIYNDTTPVLALHEMHLKNLENKLESNKKTELVLKKFQEITFPQIILKIELEIDKANLQLEDTKATKNTNRISHGLIVLVMVAIFAKVIISKADNGYYFSLMFLNYALVIYCFLYLLKNLGIILGKITGEDNKPVNIANIYRDVLIICVVSISLSILKNYFFGELDFRQELLKTEFMQMGYLGMTVSVITITLIATIAYISLFKLQKKSKGNKP